MHFQHHSFTWIRIVFTILLNVINCATILHRQKYINETDAFSDEIKNMNAILKIKDVDVSLFLLK